MQCDIQEAGIRRGNMAVSRKGAGKSPAKKRQKKTAAKKSAPEKTAVKRTAIKKTAVKKTTPKEKTAVRKNAPGKTTAKKKSAVRKTAAKKTARKQAAPGSLDLSTSSFGDQSVEITHTKGERRRQFMALLFTGVVVLLALLIINRREDPEMVKRLIKGARKAEQAGQYWKGIRKLDAALRILDRIQSRIAQEKKKLHRRLERLRKGIKQRLKRVLLLEADRLRKLASTLEGEGKADAALKILKRAQDALNRLTVPPWNRDSRLQENLKQRMKRLEKDRQRFSLRDEEIDRLLKQAKQDEDDGLYQDALKKLDKVLVLLVQLERDLHEKDRAEQQAWAPEIRSLRRITRSARRRMKRKLLDRERRRARERDERRVQDRDARRGKRQDEKRPGLRGTLKKRDNNQGTTGGTTLKHKDIKTKVKDVNSSGKKKVDYRKSAGIEKD